MSHLDEGTLHALLDGELDLAEVSEIQAHLGSCVACGSRLQEVKQFLAEADRLVGALEVPAAGRAETMPPAARPPRPTPPLAGAFHEPDPWEPPVILLPEANDPDAGRRRRFRAFGIAAMIAVIVGGGRFLLNTLHPGSSLPAARDITSTTRSVPPAVASPVETSRPESSLAVADNKVARPNAPRRTPAAKTVPAPKPESVAIAIDSASDVTDSAAAANTDIAVPDEQTLAAAGAATAASSESASSDSAVRKDTSGNQSRVEDEAETRRAAAAALAELDRERQRERAAAATAALRPARPVQPAAEAPPPPRTPEQRAQIYLRIGLDEASKQLGRPLHVIEGMTPQLIGLTQGRLVPGADPNRPVVRVVYLDTRGQMILLDQQRLRPGQTGGASQGNLRWVVGDVMLYLRGEPSAEVLMSLQRRVR
jgi:anti-sigma factor RsiW